MLAGYSIPKGSPGQTCWGNTGYISLFVAGHTPYTSTTWNSFVKTLDVAVFDPNLLERVDCRAGEHGPDALPRAPSRRAHSLPGHGAGLTHIKHLVLETL